MEMDSHGRPSESFKVYLLIKFSPLYLIQDTVNHAAAGNLKPKTVPCNKFSHFGNSGLVCVERLCWHPREASASQLCQHSSSLVPPFVLSWLLSHVLFHNIFNVADASYQINKKNLRHILCLCFDYRLLWTAILSVWKTFCISQILSSTSIFDRRPSCENF